MKEVIQGAKPTASTPGTMPARQAAPSPAYARSNNTQPPTGEWAAALVPATLAEKAVANQLLHHAGGIVYGSAHAVDRLTVTFNPQAQTMFVTFDLGTYPEGQSHRDDARWGENRRSVMFGSCSQAQRSFHDDITWPYGRAAVVHRGSMACPIIADFRKVTRTNSCRV
ncbi:hypothetical protein ACFWXK_38640 [Streptomyces sp. NPDC059070]|uniref:hypothetical protein n=1 Tax=Streptomyces sp. NPDC059070 TaxID=3346713 RepID=UPI00368BB9FD